MGAGKPKGIRAGRKLKTTRRLQRYSLNLFADGPIKITIKDFSDPDSKTPSWAAVWPRDLSLKRSVYNQNSQTQPSERESESCLRRMVRKLQLSFHGTDASTIWHKTTKSSWPVSVKRVNLKVISRVSVSKLLPSRVSPSLPFSLERRKRNDKTYMFLII